MSNPDFSGQFSLNAPLSVAHRAYLVKFSETRRMQRDETLAAARPDPVREAVKLPVGKEGGYFVGAGQSCGQEHSPDVVNYNSPPQDQPGLWCRWIPSEDGMAIEWDGTEKFRDPTEWLRYLIYHFLAPWGYVVNGTVRWLDYGGAGHIRVVNNEVFEDGDSA